MEIENMRVCCVSCNTSMNNQNLYAYIMDKDMKGPGRKNVEEYLNRHPDQCNDKSIRKSHEK